MSKPATWDAYSWGIDLPSGKITLYGSVGGAMNWSYSSTSEGRVLASGTFTSSNSFTQDSKTAQTAATTALKALAAKITSYASEIPTT